MIGLDISKFEGVLAEKRQGLNAVEIYASNSKNFEISILDGEIDKFDLSHTSGVCLRADCGQIGYSYSEHPMQDPVKMLDTAIQNAQNSESNDAEFLRFYEGAEKYEQVPQVDPMLVNSSADEKIELAFELEKLALSQDPSIKRLQNCAVNTVVSESAIRNSLGLSVSQQMGYAIAYCSSVAEKNGEVKNGFFYDIARNIQEINLEKIASKAAKNALDQFNASQVKSGFYSVVLKNEAMNSLLASFSSLFSADAAQKGFSMLAGREGDLIGSERVDIYDDPFYPDSIFKSAYDAEGVPASRTSVVRAGVFNTFLHNRKTAQKANAATTGNAAKGSISGPIGVAPTNFILSPQNNTRDELFKQMNNGLYITDFSGMHSGVNPIAGSFSLLSKGFLIENGEITRPVEQITVAGTFLDLLKAITAIGNDARLGMGMVICPSVLVDGLQVAGS